MSNETLQARQTLWNAWRHLRRYDDAADAMELLMNLAVGLTQDLLGR